MRVWTIQRLGAWETACRVGLLRGDPAFAFENHDDGIWRESYAWMVEQMHKRLPGYSGDLPIWAWLHRPDMRCYDAGLGYVLLRADVPKQRVLLSDFDAWHCVLNRWYSTRTEAEENSYPEERQEVSSAMRQTWENIFNLERDGEAERYWLGEHVDVQACIDRIYLDEVNKVTLLKRRCK